MSKKEPILAWHYLSDDRRMRYNDHRLVKAGRTYKAQGPLCMCEKGMHGSERLIDALEYAPGSLICRVELRPPYIVGDDKICARSRHVLWMVDAAETLHRFATWCAKRELKRYDIKHPDLWAALKVKELWLRGKASDVELDAARDAAWAVARGGAWAAAKAAGGAAAWAVARAAARAAAQEAALVDARAAWAAVGAAAWDAAQEAALVDARAAGGAAAWAAAWDAEFKLYNRKLTDMVKKLHATFGKSHIIRMILLLCIMGMHWMY